jgi:ribosomal protein S6
MARKKAVTQASTEALEPRVYELGFLLSPAVREEDLDSRVDEIKLVISEASGTIVADARPEFIDIAYEMIRVIDNKNIRFNQGYFGWIKFTLTPDQLKEVTEKIEKNNLIIRMLITKTILENTVISKKPLSKILKTNIHETLAEGEVIADDETDIDGDEEIDPGIAAIELQTPTNDEIAEIESIDTAVEALPEETQE